MFNFIGKIAISALIAGVIVFLTSVVPEAKAAKDTAAPAFAKGDRLVVVKGAACSRRSWPNYEEHCLFDSRRSADEARKVFVVDLDRREMPSRAPIIDVLALR
jgi:hypothetical protein